MLRLGAGREPCGALAEQRGARAPSATRADALGRPADRAARARAADAGGRALAELATERPGAQRRLRGPAAQAAARRTTRRCGPAFDWIDERLAERGHDAEELTRREHHRQAANQVSVGNCITSMRADRGARLDATSSSATSVVERALRRRPGRRLRGDGRALARPLPPRGRAAGRAQRRRRARGRATRARRGWPRQPASGPPPAPRRLLPGRRRPAARSSASSATARRSASAAPAVAGAPAAAFYLGADRRCCWLALRRGPLACWRRGASAPARCSLVALLLLLPASEVAVSLVNLRRLAAVRRACCPSSQFEDGIPDELPHAGGRADPADQRRRACASCSRTWRSAPSPTRTRTCTSRC